MTLSRIPKVKRWKVTFYFKPYDPGHYIIEYVDAPTKILALWAGREQRYGCIIAHPNCVKETISLVRRVNHPDYSAPGTY